MIEKPMKVVELKRPERGADQPSCCNARCILATKRIFSFMALLAIIGSATLLTMEYPDRYVGYYLIAMAILMTAVESRLPLDAVFRYCIATYQSIQRCCSKLKTDFLKSFWGLWENTCKYVLDIWDKLDRFCTAYDKTTIVGTSYSTHKPDEVITITNDSKTREQAIRSQEDMTVGTFTDEIVDKNQNSDVKNSEVKTATDGNSNVDSWEDTPPFTGSRDRVTVATTKPTSSKQTSVKPTSSKQTTTKPTSSKNRLKRRESEESVWNDCKLWCRPYWRAIKPVFKFIFKILSPIIRNTFLLLAKVIKFAIDVCLALVCMTLSVISYPFRGFWYLVINLGDRTQFVLYTVMAASMCMVESIFWPSIACGCVLELVAVLNLMTYYNKLTRPLTETHIMRMVEKSVSVRDLDKMNAPQGQKKKKKKVQPGKGNDKKEENTNSKIKDSKRAKTVQPDNETRDSNTTDYKKDADSKK